MSKLHERLLKHRHMSLKEKEDCQCDMCKGLRVGKVKIIPPESGDIKQTF